MPEKRIISSNPRPSAASNIPTPFTSAPTRLKPFLAQCDPSKAYIAHIDRHAAAYKQNIFLIPVLLNATVAALLLWRAYVAAPTYWALLLALLRQNSVARVPAEATRAQKFGAVLWRAGMVFADFALFRLVGPWPWTFFAEQPANPVSWRWTLGFKDEEVVVRVSRGWGAVELVGGERKGADSPWFKTRVLPAVSRETMGKTGYLLMDKSWDLDFELMLDAHTLVQRGELEFDDVDEVVLVHFDGPTGWCAWRWEGQRAAKEQMKKAVERLETEMAHE